MTTEDREALIQLRRVVEAAPDHLFHMQALTQETECGTAHCALGWAQQDKWFKKNMLGLRELYYFAAFRAAGLFGLSRRQADDLFGGHLSTTDEGHPVSKKEVIWNIDELLAGRDTRPYAATRVGGDYVPTPE